MPIEKLLNSFLVAKEAIGLSSRTLRWYRDNLRLYLCFCDQQDRCWREPFTVDEFLAQERRRGIAPATVSARYRALSAWFGWLVTRNLIDASPTLAITRPNTPKPRIRHVTYEEYRQLLASIDLATWIDHRDYAIIQMFFWCGLRRSECANLHIADLDFAEGLVHVRNGKGDKDRVVPVLDEAQAAVLSYLNQRPDWPPPALWLGEDIRTHRGAGGPFGSDGIRLMLERRCRRANMRRLNAHAWRHGFAMVMLNHGADLSSISTMLGHGNVKITADIYARWLTSGIKREYHEAATKIRARPRNP